MKIHEKKNNAPPVQKGRVFRFKVPLLFGLLRLTQKSSVHAKSPWRWNSYAQLRVVSYVNLSYNETTPQLPKFVGFELDLKQS